jgi:hypothetical protein
LPSPRLPAPVLPQPQASAIEYACLILVAAALAIALRATAARGSSSGSGLPVAFGGAGAADDVSFSGGGPVRGGHGGLGGGAKGLLERIERDLGLLPPPPPPSPPPPLPSPSPPPRPPTAEERAAAARAAARAMAAAARATRLREQLEALLAFARAVDPKASLGWATAAGADGAYCRAFAGVTCTQSQMVQGISLPADRHPRLEGTLPGAGYFAQRWVYLKTLEVASPGLHGPLPPVYGSLKNLQTLKLHGRLTGGLPSEWAGMLRLKSLSL